MPPPPEPEAADTVGPSAARSGSAVGELAENARQALIGHRMR